VLRESLLPARLGVRAQQDFRECDQVVLGLVVSTQRQEMNKSLYPAASVDAPIASVFHFVGRRRRAIDQRRFGVAASRAW
jgi:hypothetical protein